MAFCITGPGTKTPLRLCIPSWLLARRGELPKQALAIKMLLL